MQTAKCKLPYPQITQITQIYKTFLIKTLSIKAPVLRANKGSANDKKLQTGKCKMQDSKLKDYFPSNQFCLLNFSFFIIKY